MPEEYWDALFVEKYYVMDAVDEDLLFDGTKLRNGMEVLIESSDFREDMATPMDSRKMSAALKWNRWSYVSELQILPNAVSFIAIYDDGSKRKIDAPRDMAWFVKKHTMPTPEQGLEIRKIEWDLEIRKVEWDIDANRPVQDGESFPAGGTDMRDFPPSATEMRA